MGKTVDDGVQRGEVQLKGRPTTHRKNKQNEGVLCPLQWEERFLSTGGEILGSDGAQSNEWKQTAC